MKLVQREPVEDDTNIYEIQQILNHRPREGRDEMEYLVRWKGYTPEHDSWVPFTDFIQTGLIEKYRRRRGISGLDERSGKKTKSSSKLHHGQSGSVLGSKVVPGHGSNRTHGMELRSSEPLP